jgi:hypothetical protein
LCTAAPPAGWSEQQVLASRLALRPEALRGMFAFSAEGMREEVLCAMRAASA